MLAELARQSIARIFWVTKRPTSTTHHLHGLPFSSLCYLLYLKLAGRWGEPGELAKAVLFLASEDSSYVNAVELMVDGGATGAPFGAPILRG